VKKYHCDKCLPIARSLMLLSNFVCKVQINYIHAVLIFYRDCIKQEVCTFIKNQKELSLWIQNNYFHAVTSTYLFKVACIVTHEGDINRKEREEEGKCFGLEDTNLPISASNQTLSIFYKQILHQCTASIVASMKPPTTNYNASKLDILR
jgi:hypothetical protein